ncbi:MAG TPA: hypothetical protein VN426_14655 [Syntrophomonadaceae bacterium]|nr:hypothetical protein [Syntrophomonadaceae bacterium]
MSPLKKVVPREDYRLEVPFDNGSTVILNLEGRLSTVRFGLLRDKNFFARVTTDGNYIKWEDKIEISVSEVFQLAQK